MKRTVNLMVLHYNARDMLRDYLPSVVEAAKRSRHDCRVTVIDNASTDGSAQMVREYFPSVKVMDMPENRILMSFNDAARAVKDEILFLLNNDMKLDPGFVDPMVESFECDDAFFSASHGNRSLVKFRWGILESSTVYPGHKRLFARQGLTLAAGACAVDRQKFLELGGFDPLYLPGRYEDVDLCYRAWKRGWRGYYVPQSTQTHGEVGATEADKHKGGVSFGKVYNFKQIQRMVYRNSLLFMLKNISDPVWALRWMALLPFRLLAALLTGKFFILQGFGDALMRSGQALDSRREARAHWRISDREILKRVNGGFRERLIRRGKGWVDVLGRSAFARACFSIFGFFTLRFLRPAEFLLLRELSDCQSVLDLGCGRHSIVPILPSSARTTGVELFRAHLDEAIAKGRHDEYIHADITKVDFPDKSFDAVVMLDVLEHLPQEAGGALIAKMRRWARRKVVVFTPNGFIHQHEVDDNPLMEHQSGWTAKDLQAQGFRVFGVRGFKGLKKHEHGPDGHEKVDSFWDWTQVFSYHFPSEAFQLFAVADASRVPAGSARAESVCRS